MGETVVSTELSPKKIFGQKIFGSNLFLKNRKIGFTPINPYATLRVARENFSENQKSCVLARDEGIEPPPTVLETAVLPLYEPPILNPPLFGRG